MLQNLAWRSLALLAAFTYVLLVLITALLLIHNLAMSFILIITSVLLVYAAWLIFVGESRRARLGYFLGAIGISGLVVELGYLFTNRENRRAIILMGIISVIYFALLGLIRRKYWAEKRRKGMATGKRSHFKNAYLIINPKSGNGRATKAHVDTLAKSQGVHVITTRMGEDIESIARQAALAGADVLGISGGDGSIGAVAKVAIEQDLPIVVLPGGTRCHFARDLGLNPKHICDALSGFTGVERRIDVASINGRIFLNNASFGLYADIVNQPGYRSNKKRVTRNVVRSIVNGRKGLYRLHFNHGTLHAEKALQVLVGVNRYASFNIFELGHRERLEEGVLQITAITEGSKEVVRRLTRRFFSNKIDSNKELPGFYQWVDGMFKVTSNTSKIVVGVDGEREEHTSPVIVQVFPAALRVYVPAEGNRGRPKNAFSISMLRRIARAGSRLG